MNNLEQTYEIKIYPTNVNIKDDLILWLRSKGIYSFVEGVIEDPATLNDSYKSDDEVFNLFSGCLPISIYKYNINELNNLGLELQQKGIEYKIASFNSNIWKEGWKKGLKPIIVDNFYIYPPWEQPSYSPEMIPLMIEPAMAFGTGLHETTRLCLKMLNYIAKIDLKNILDIGTGTGILAIAAKKLGASDVLGTDIDEDALSAAKKNAKDNKVNIKFNKGSFIKGEYNLIIANILTFILKDLIPTFNIHKNSKVILSGILFTEKHEIINLCLKYNLELLKILQEGEWVSLLLEKK